MHSSVKKKGNQWHFGMKVPTAWMPEGFVPHSRSHRANVPRFIQTVAEKLLREDDEVVLRGQRVLGLEKRERNQK